MLAEKYYLYRIHIDSQGYDSNGAYFGIGKPVYCAELVNTTNFKHTRAYSYLYLRAENREAAKQELRKTRPNAVFFR
jgi:hypothetical protein